MPNKYACEVLPALQTLFFLIMYDLSFIVYSLPVVPLPCLTRKESIRNVKRNI